MIALLMLAEAAAASPMPMPLFSPDAGNMDASLRWHHSVSQPTISSGLKKKAVSVAAFSSLLEPWTELASIDSA